MRLLPIPIYELEASRAIWLPFVAQLAKHQGGIVEQHLADIYSGTNMLVLAYEDKALAAAAISIVWRGPQRIARIVWIAGTDRKRWTGLLPQLERYCREHLNCTGMTTIARIGWTKELQRAGYRRTRIVFEKDFG